MKTIYFIASSVTPEKNAKGGNLVIYRHLKKLENEGYDIKIIQTYKRNKLSEFKEINISRMRFPLRKNSFSKKCRLALDYQKVVWKLKKNDSIIISILGDYSSLLSYHISNHANIPFYLIYHDDNLFDEVYSSCSILTSSETIRIISACKHIFAVSQPMKDLLLKNGAASVSLLYPMPEGVRNINRNRNLDKNLFHIGTIYENIHECIIRKIAKSCEINSYKFNLIANISNSFRTKFENENNINFINQLSQPNSLFDLLIDKADLMIVFYSDHYQERRSTYSFPSKFVELSHLTIPIIIIAPEQSALGKWCIEHNWLTYSKTEDLESINILIQSLKNDDFWKSCSEQAKLVSDTIFNPINIHLQLLNALH